MKFWLNRLVYIPFSKPYLPKVDASALLRSAISAIRDTENTSKRSSQPAYTSLSISANRHDDFQGGTIVQGEQGFYIHRLSVGSLGHPNNHAKCKMILEQAPRPERARSSCRSLSGRVPAIENHSAF
jgi:hypothetical protein